MTSPTPDALVSLWESASRDEGWGGRARALSPGDRARLLDRASEVAGDDPGLSARATACLWALADAVDFGRRSHLVLLDRQLRAPISFDPGLARLVERVAEGEADSAHAAHAVFHVAQRDAVNGRLPRAERRLRTLLAEVTGRGDRLEGETLMYFANLCLRSRREFEALVLGRRALAIGERHDDAKAMVGASMVIGHVLSSFEDVARLPAVLARVEALVLRLPPGHVSLLRLWLHTRHAHEHCQQGRWRETLVAVEAAESLVKTMDDAGWDARWGPRMRADVLRASGRLDEAARALASALTLGRADDAVGLGLRATALEVAVERKDPAMPEEARTWLAAMAGAAGAALPPGARLELLRRVAPALAGVTGLDAEARQAYDLAAASGLERLAQIDRFTRDYPDTARPSADDLAVFADDRRRRLGQHRDLQAAVSRWLTQAAREGRWTFAGLPAVSDLVVICAWCQALRTPDGAWVPLPTFLPVVSEGPLQVTHSICPHCHVGLLRELDPARARAR